MENVKFSGILMSMLAIAKIPQVVAIKMGSRDMSRLGHEYRVLKEEAPDVPQISCHDEYLLASLLAGADGVLVGTSGSIDERHGEDEPGRILDQAVQLIGVAPLGRRRVGVRSPQPVGRQRDGVVGGGDGRTVVG